MRIVKRLSVVAVAVLLLSSQLLRADDRSDKFAKQAEQTQKSMQELQARFMELAKKAKIEQETMVYEIQTEMQRAHAEIKAAHESHARVEEIQRIQDEMSKRIQSIHDYAQDEQNQRMAAYQKEKEQILNSLHEKHD